MNNKKIIGICEFIIENFNEEGIELEKYIINNIEHISEKIEMNIDEFYDVIKRKNILERISLKLKKITDNNIPRIIVEHKTFIYIRKNDNLNEESLNRYNKLSKKLKKLVDAEESKGRKFEIFCTKFLNDLDITSIKTRDSNDEGIDIIGVVHNLNNLDFIMPTHINIIAQVKNKSDVVDLSHIRKFIGDSLFIKFSKDKMYKDINNHPLYLIFFSSNGFTDSAIKFAQSQGVYLFSANDILRILILKNNFENLKSVRYLMDNF